MTPAERSRLRALADAATPGPWRAHDADWIAQDADDGPANCSFIAASRTAIPALLDALDERDRLLAECREEIDWRACSDLVARIDAALAKDRGKEAASGAREVSERCPGCDREACDWYAFGKPGDPRIGAETHHEAYARALHECANHAVDWRARTLAAEAVARFADYYRREGAWGCLHVCFSDGNWDCPPDDTYCETDEELELASIVRQLTPSQRRKLEGRCHEIVRLERAR